MRLRKGKHSVLAISDLQIPFEHKDALEFCLAVEAAYECDTVVCMGDEVDQMAMSRYDPDPEGDGPSVELQKSILRLHDWYREFPDVKVCRSNHTDRVYKRAFLAGIPERYLRPVEDWLEAPPGWKWDEAHEVDGVLYVHGDANSGMHAARNLAVRYRQSVVIGHHHSHGGVLYIANDKEMIFGLNTGCLIDRRSIAFKYAKHAAHAPTLGVGVVRFGVPHFVPMLLDARGRWIGEVV